MPHNHNHINEAGEREYEGFDGVGEENANNFQNAGTEYFFFLLETGLREAGICIFYTLYTPNNFFGGTFNFFRVFLFCFCLVFV